MDWQPIETAPKNPAGQFTGPIILVWCTADEMVWPAYWGQRDDTTGCWQIFDGSGPGDQIMPQDASHWMPLPKPPTS